MTLSEPTCRRGSHHEGPEFRGLLYPWPRGRVDGAPVSGRRRGRVDSRRRIADGNARRPGQAVIAPIAVPPVDLFPNHRSETIGRKKSADFTPRLASVQTAFGHYWSALASRRSRTFVVWPSALTTPKPTPQRLTTAGRLPDSSRYERRPCCVPNALPRKAQGPLWCSDGPGFRPVASRPSRR